MTIPEGFYKVSDKLVPSEDTAIQAVNTLLLYIGADVDESGLLETPKRVVKALTEMTEGSKEDPIAILSKKFDVIHDEMIILKNIPFTSLCCHHLLPFTGTAAVAYIPKDGTVVGLSKLARLVQCFARRLQIQERMTGEIADAIQTHLQPLGSACIIKAEHSCLACRGAKLSGTSFITSALRGVLREDKAARAELMSLIQ